MSETQENFEVLQGGLGYDYVISCSGGGFWPWLGMIMEGGREFEINDFLIT